jgi:tRNA U34 5-carboxymethylaminomethyl modifying GTPase MnmE/TrmE
MTYHELAEIENRIRDEFCVAMTEAAVDHTTASAVEQIISAYQIKVLQQVQQQVVGALYHSDNQDWHQALSELREACGSAADLCSRQYAMTARRALRSGGPGMMADVQAVRGHAKFEAYMNAGLRALQEAKCSPEHGHAGISRGSGRIRQAG